MIKVKEVKLYGASQDQGALDVKGYLDLTKIYGNVYEGWSVVKDENTRVIYTWTPRDTKDRGNLKLTASQLDHTCTKIETDPNSYLCVIPQQRVRIMIMMENGMITHFICRLLILYSRELLNNRKR